MAVIGKGQDVLLVPLQRLILGLVCHPGLVVPGNDLRRGRRRDIKRWGQAVGSTRVSGQKSRHPLPAGDDDALDAPVVIGEVAQLHDVEGPLLLLELLEQLAIVEVPEAHVPVGRAREELPQAHVEAGAHDLDE